MVLTLILLFGLLSTPVATSVGMTSSPTWTVPTGAAMKPTPTVEPGVETTKPEEPIVVTRLLVVGDVVLVANTDRMLLGLDIHTGAQLWATVTAEDVLAPMAVHGNTLLLPGGSGTLFVFDIETGRMTDAVVLGAEPLLEPLVIGNTVVVSDERGTVHMIDAESFEVRETIVVGGTMSHAAIAGDLAIFASEGGMISAIDPETSSVQWQNVLAGKPAQLQATGDSIAIGMDSGDLLLLYAADGDIRWHQAHVASLFTDLAYTRTEVLGITGAGDVLVMDLATGAPEWRGVVPAAGWFAGEHCDSACPVVTADGSLFLFAPASRERLVPVTVVQNVGAPPAATDEVLVVATMSGDVYGWVLKPD